MSSLALKTTAVVGGVTFLGWVIMKTTSPSKEEMMKVKNVLIFAFLQEKSCERLFLNYFIASSRVPSNTLYFYKIKN